MKQKLLKTLLLLSALVVGLGNAWADAYSGIFKKITSTSDFTTGYYVVAASESASSNAGYALGNSVDSNKRMSGVSVSISSGTTITNPDDAIVWYITVSGTTITIKNVNNNKYIYQVSTTSGKGMGLTTTSTNLTLAGYNSDSPIGFKFTLDGASNNYFKYNAGSKWFANYANEYTTSMTPVRLFKLSYTVTYDANGGTGTMTDTSSPYIGGSTVTVKSNSFTRDGYNFNGWNTKANGSGTSYAAGATFSISENTTLYAQWVSAGDYISSTPTSADIDVAGDVAEFELSTNLADPSYAIKYYTTADGDVEASKPSWLGEVEFAGSTLDIVVNENTGAARTAYFKVYSGDTYSDVITINQAAYVAVTGVTLDEDELSLEVGGTATLTPTITPATASNKAVSWESDDTGVATVDSDGKVTAVGVGTANITVTSDDDDDYYATCEVTVTAGPALTLDLSQTSWGFPADYKTAAGTYTNNGYSFTVGATTDGHKAMTASTVQKGIIFGKNGAMITFTALPFNVTKIKVYGLSGAASGVKFNIFVYDEEKAVDVAVSSEVTGSNTDHEFAIAAGYQAAGTVYKLKLTTTDKNCQISKIVFYGENVPVTIGAAGYTTFSAPCAVDFSATALEVYTAAVNGGKTAVTLTSVAGKKVPANNAVILKGATATGKVAASASALVGNELLVSDGSVEGDGSTIFALGVGKSGDATGKVGFYLVTKDVTVPAGKAYLEVTGGGGVKEFLGFDFEDADGISLTPALSEGEGEIYNLAGQRLQKMQKGINIVNGKKILF